MSISEPETQPDHRPVGRGAITGLLVTAAVHGGLIFAVYQSQVRAAPPPVAVRDLMVTHMINLGKPREKFWLPRVVEPPPPVKPPPEVIKVTEHADAAPAPPPPVKPPPQIEDHKISTDLRRALQRAKALSQSAKEEPPEGSLTGSTEGTTSTASEGDEYATQVFNAIHRNWSAPSGLLDDAQLKGLSAEVLVVIGDGGQLGTPTLTKSSGNELFDDSCLQAVRATGRVPPVPATMRARYRRGVTLDFAGKELAR
jgi:TonB family protein